MRGWSQQRLSRLFDRYNQRYWSGRLPWYRFVVGPDPAHKDALGTCRARQRIIHVDIASHKSDREVRSTLLHEMAHAATKKRSHGVNFFAQLEKLLGKGAPISVGNPEAGYARILADIVPARFPLTKRMMDRAEARRRRTLEKLMRSNKIRSLQLTEEMIIGDFADAAMELPWKKSLLAVGLEYGLVDETGRPVNGWASRIARRGKATHARGRRDHLQYMRAHNQHAQSENAGGVRARNQLDVS